MILDIPHSSMDEDNEIFLSEDDIEEEIEIIEDGDFADDNDDNEYNDGEGQFEEENEPSGDDIPQSSESTRVTPPQDDSRVTFSGHEKAVLCCSLNSSGTFGLSGDQNDKAYLWDVIDGSVKYVYEGHKDSVICAAFNKNETRVATGDMSGLIQVWNNQIESGSQVSLCCQFEVSDLNWLEWHPIVSNVLLAGTIDMSWMWDVNDASKVKTFQASGSSCTAGKCFHNGLKIIMGYEDGTLRIFDLKTANVLSTVKDYNAHHSCVTSVDCNLDNTLAGSGSVDGTAKIINCQTGKVISTYACGNNTDDNDEDSVESVSFSSSLSLFATGCVSGIVEIWDIATHTRRHMCVQSDGISKCEWSKVNPHLLITSGLDGALRIYDGRSGQLESTKYGHCDQLLDFYFSEKLNSVLTASEDATCKLFQL